MNDGQTGMEHKVILQQRNLLTVTGVTEIVSFDETAVIANTEQGTLVVHGQQLQLKTLRPEGGQVEVVGKISGLMYEQSNGGTGWWKRLLG